MPRVAIASLKKEREVNPSEPWTMVPGHFHWALSAAAPG